MTEINGAAAGNGAAAPVDSSLVGADGQPVVEPAAQGSDDPTPMVPGVGTDPTGGENPLATDECGLNTGYPGDDYCILPPPAGEGFQIRVGPENYASPDSRYLLLPGAEATSDFGQVSGNDQDIFFYSRQFRMRPGAHHMIISSGNNPFGGTGRRIGTANASGDFPSGGAIAPENQGVGLPLDANSSINVSLHTINVTDVSILREIWANYWYRDPALVTESADQLFETGSTLFSVAPGERTILGPYTCDISGNGRLLWFYGHRHANNLRFSAWRVRGGQRDLFYEAFDWEEVLTLEYNSLVTNPVANRDLLLEGGWSGVLDLQSGDKIEWECDVLNTNDTTLRFTNQTYLGEMCILDGEIVGTNCN